ncbi:reverse transcriptase domain, reverse transcriptase zinc-binding domain protein [Tanacetum coccineum]
MGEDFPLISLNKFSDKDFVAMLIIFVAKINGIVGKDKKFVSTPAHINDYRPISCCNVLYKCISKIIDNCAKEGLGDIVSINQSTFVPGHRISAFVPGPPRCVFKVDIQKAYDMVDWKFLKSILVGFDFQPKMVQWIMVCVSGASYSICVNGNLHGWFKGKRGLQQGDPLSPYLFTLVMEILTLMLQRRVHNSDDFQYHHLCDQERIIKLCFADDLFLFARGHTSLVSVILDVLEEFKQVSSLVPSIPKSIDFFCNVPNAIKASILNCIPFAEGALPLMHGFLWCQGEMKKWKAKVTWDSECMPKHEGGLGIHRIDDFFIALMATHIWSILTHRESLWVKWVHMYKLKGHSFWDVPCRGDVDVCPHKDLLSNKDIVRLGFSLDDLVSNLIADGIWRWPLDWLSRFPFMAQLQVPLLHDDMDDVILWRDRDGVLRPFLVACVWDTIQSRADRKLKTQDRLWQWDVGVSIDLNLLRCPLCDLVLDSHDVVAFIVPISMVKTVVIILSRIVFAATSYYIWLERNNRLFKKMFSSPDQIVDVILSMVRLKLVAFKFKKMSTKSRLLLDQWKIPSYCIVHDGSTRRQTHLDRSCSFRAAAILRDVRSISCSHLGSCLA